MKTGQIAFSIDFATSYAAADYYVGSANEAVFATLTEKTEPEKTESEKTELPQAENFLFLRGDEACGKTHLVHVFCETHKARVLSDADLRQDFAALNLPGMDFAVDDADKLSPAAQESLFHLYNSLRPHPHRRLLLTSSLSAADIIERDKTANSGLGDWHSRLSGFQMMEIFTAPPDDALLIGFLQKNFRDRQIYAKCDELRYILRHAERHPAYLLRLIDGLHSTMLERKLGLSQSLIGEYLKKIAKPAESL